MTSSPTALLPRSGTLGDGQFQHHDRIVFQTCQETLESHVSDDKGPGDVALGAHNCIVAHGTKSSVPGGHPFIARDKGGEIWTWRQDESKAVLQSQWRPRCWGCSGNGGAGLSTA